MPRHPQHQAPSKLPYPEAPKAVTTQAALADPNAGLPELPPVRVEHKPLETFDLAPDPAKAVDQPVIEAPRQNPVLVDDRPLSALTHEELIAELNRRNNATKVARPLNEAHGPRPAMTDRQMTQREAELARGAERVAKNEAIAATMPRRPPLTSLEQGRQNPLPKPPLPLRTQPVPLGEVEARAEQDAEYVPDMNHGYIETNKRSPGEYATNQQNLAQRKG